MRTKPNSSFLFLGILFLCAGLLLGWLCVDVPPQLLWAPEEALYLPEAFMEAITSGDPERAGSLLLGQPRLRIDREEMTPLSVLLWNGYTDSLQYEFQGRVTATDSGICRLVTVTALDIPALMRQLKETAPELLAQEALVIGEDQAFGKDHHYRQEFVEDVLLQALRDDLSKDPPTLSREYRLEMVLHGNTWQILPDQDLLDLLCGTIV